MLQSPEVELLIGSFYSSAAPTRGQGWQECCAIPANNFSISSLRKKQLDLYLFLTKALLLS